jgi:hypothetical protein
MHNNVDGSSIFIFENVRFTTPTQQLHNNPLHEGEFYTLGSTLMWGVVVHLLWWCSAGIKSLLFFIF